MRLVIAIEGDLLVPRDNQRGMGGQREEIARVVSGLGPLLRQGHSIVIVHGNAPQIGYVLLRSEAASHVMHPLPLDICGSDTQGATGYLLQQALQNWYRKQSLATEVATVITQVVVDITAAADEPVRGIGPFYDPDKAQAYAIARNWHFVLTPGRGYRRAVPSIKPKAVVELETIRGLLANGVVVICGGGGGIPVVQQPDGELVGAEAVVDKAYTAGLLGAQLGADALVFVAFRDRLAPLLGWHQQGAQADLLAFDVAQATAAGDKLGADLRHKLVAAQQFLEKGGGRVVFCPPDAISLAPAGNDGFVFERAPAGAFA